MYKKPKYDYDWRLLLLGVRIGPSLIRTLINDSKLLERTSPGTLWTLMS